MIAVILPGSVTKSMSESTSSFAPGYLKSTWLKRITPLWSASVTGAFGSFTVLLVLMTSSIRSAATPALGSMMDMAESMRNDMTIIMAYVINAVIVPTCI